MSSAAPCTRCATSPASCPSATTASSRRAGGGVFDDAALAGRGAPRPAGDRRRLPRRLPVGDGRHRPTTSTRSSRTCAGRPSTASGSGRTNLLERTFVEVRRRTKVIGRFPGETSALSLIWAVLELSSRGWRGVVMTPTDRRRDRTPPPRTAHHQHHAPDNNSSGALLKGVRGPGFERGQVEPHRPHGSGPSSATTIIAPPSTLAAHVG